MAVIGHVEWVEFAVVPRLPHPGEILHVHEFWDEAAGGGAVAAVQMAKLTGRSMFVTALAGDPLGAGVSEQLARHGVTVHAGARPGIQRRGFVYLTDDGERTITILGDRLVPHGDDELPWELLDDVGGVYFTGGDAGALRAARRAGVIVATPRAGDALREAGVAVDVLVHSGKDRDEEHDPSELDPAPQERRHDAGREGRALGRRGRQRQLGAAPAAGADRRRVRRGRLVRRRASPPAWRPGCRSRTRSIWVRAAAWRT